MSEDKPLNDSADRKRSSDGALTQEFRLYIKASQIDKETRGSCPICQQWFMIAYLIAQEQEGVNFSVFTVQDNNVPAEFKGFGWSKTFPVVAPLNCTDKTGSAIGNELKDGFDELETFFESINRLCPELKRHNKENAQAMKSIEKLYATFNGVMTGQPIEKLYKALDNLDKDLNNGCVYLIDDAPCFVDTFLLPRLHHIRVALERYNIGEIPQSCRYVWRYLAHAYKHPAFLATMPSDQDIVNHYVKKTPYKDRVGKIALEKFTYNTNVPEEVEEMMKENGDAPPETPVQEVVQEQQSLEEEEQPNSEEQVNDANGISSE